MLNILLKKLIKTSAGRTRFIMAVVGLSIAMLLILCAVQVEMNYNDMLNSSNNRDSLANFLVINKEVTGENTTTLSDAEIADLKKQPFVDATGLLTPSRFKVSAQSVSNRIPFYTDFFFESVPNEFIDVQSADWKWDDNSQYIPMIVPNMFLTMYNFGFAPSQGLPQLSPELVKSLLIQINITGPAGKVSYYGKVVGFSDRISSVLVPQAFMDWANAKYGEAQSEKPSRIIIKTKDPGNPILVDYLKKHGLTTDSDKTRFSKIRQVVNIVVSFSWITGAVMLLFALLVFALFIQLTIASAKNEIYLLITLGAGPRQLQRFLMKQFFPPNIIITAIVLCIIAGLQVWLQHVLQMQNIYVNPVISVYTIAAGILVLLVLWLVNLNTIRKYIRQE
ncbi:MAG TPA: FtsX-like permease family protein [Chitinophagaceae bacterium]|nr:FtsX-like permease family protein [Chitinophagaceae bacterium]